MPNWACVNGVYSSIERAVISINDRGLLFADGVYEVFRVLGGRQWSGSLHWKRLERSLGAIGISADLGPIRAQLAETVRQSELEDALVYLQITRGTAPRQ